MVIFAGQINRHCSSYSWTRYCRGRGYCSMRHRESCCRYGRSIAFRWRLRGAASFAMEQTVRCELEKWLCYRSTSVLLLRDGVVGAVVSTSGSTTRTYITLCSSWLADTRGKRLKYCEHACSAVS